MSQHYFNTQRNGHDVSITLGYDRPLDKYFLNVEQEGVDSDDAIDSGGQILNDQAVFYISLYDLNAPVDDMDYFREKLKSLGLIVPESLFLAVEEDAVEHVGNYVVRHFADGRTEVLHPKS